MPTLSPSNSPDDRSDDLSYLEVEARVAALAESGDGGAARARLVGFLAQHPSCAEAHNDLGVLAYEAGELATALAVLSRSLSLDPTDEETVKIITDLEIARRQSH